MVYGFLCTWYVEVVMDIGNIYWANKLLMSSNFCVLLLMAMEFWLSWLENAPELVILDQEDSNGFTQGDRSLG